MTDKMTVHCVRQATITGKHKQSPREPTQCLSERHSSSKPDQSTDVERRRQITDRRRASKVGWRAGQGRYAQELSRDALGE